MAERECGTCHRFYIVPEGRTDPGYCSDRCFSEAQGDDKSSGSGGIFKLALVVGVVALAIFRIEASTWIAYNVPQVAPWACTALSACGAEGVDRLVTMVLESDALRGPALEALQRVEGADLQTRLSSKLDPLRKQALKMTRAEAGLLLQALGRCKVAESYDDMITAMEVPEMQLAAIHALGYLGEEKAETPLLDLLNEADFKFKNQPELVAAMLTALSELPDHARERTSRFFPYLAHDSPVVRGAAAEAIGLECSDYQDMKAKLLPTTAMDQTELKAILMREEKGLAAVQAAGPAEKEPGARAAMADAVSKMIGGKPEWAN